MGKVCDIDFYPKEYSRVGIADNLTVIFVIKGVSRVAVDMARQVVLEEDELIAVNPSARYELVVETGIAAQIIFRKEEVYRLLRGKLRRIDCCNVNIPTGSFVRVLDRIKN